MRQQRRRVGARGCLLWLLGLVVLLLAAVYAQYAQIGAVRGASEGVSAAASDGSMADNAASAVCNLSAVARPCRSARAAANFDLSPLPSKSNVMRQC